MTERAQKIWEWLKGYFTYGSITDDFKEEIHKIKLEIESEIKINALEQLK